MLLIIGFSQTLAGQNNAAKIADKALFKDPVRDGAPDPYVVWNSQENKWYMFYTNRRANTDSLDDVSWVHGTKIGIATSEDGGATWSYKSVVLLIPNQHTSTPTGHWIL